MTPDEVKELIVKVKDHKTEQEIIQRTNKTHLDTAKKMVDELVKLNKDFLESDIYKAFDKIYKNQDSLEQADIDVLLKKLDEAITPLVNKFEELLRC